MVTPEHAHYYGRDVFAVPGRVNDSQSAGCLNLIRTDKARMITSAADVAYWMGWESNPKPKVVQKELFISMTGEEELLFNLLETKTSLDALALEAKLPIRKVAAILFQLEMKGCVHPLAGKQFERAQYPILERTRIMTSVAISFAFSAPFTSAIVTSAGLFW